VKRKPQRYSPKKRVPGLGADAIDLRDRQVPRDEPAGPSKLSPEQERIREEFWTQLRRQHQEAIAEGELARSQRRERDELAAAAAVAELAVVAARNQERLNRLARLAELLEHLAALEDLALARLYAAEEVSR
jgi:hypothetical protein